MSERYAHRQIVYPIASAVWNSSVVAVVHQRDMKCSSLMFCPRWWHFPHMGGDLCLLRLMVWFGADHCLPLLCCCVTVPLPPACAQNRFAHEPHLRADFGIPLPGGLLCSPAQSLHRRRPARCQVVAARRLLTGRRRWAAPTVPARCDSLPQRSVLAQRRRWHANLFDVAGLPTCVIALGGGCRAGLRFGTN